MNLEKQRKKVDNALGELKACKRIYREEKSKFIEAEDHLVYAEEAQSLIQKVSQQIQQKIHRQISTVVTKCLVMVTEDNYGFKINFERKRGRTEADLILLYDGHEINNPLNSDSGGIVEIAAFALRVSCLLLTKPSLDRVLIMDEPFKSISNEYQENVKKMLTYLSKSFGFQFIIVTHIQNLITGKVIKL